MGDDEKSFRERVEEIRERRQDEESTDDNPNVGQGVQANQQGGIPSNIPDMDQLLEQTATEMPGCRIIVETDDTRLEFLDQSLFKSQTQSGPMYQLLGEPDRKEPLDDYTGNQEPTPSTSSNSNTQVFTPDAGGGSESQDTSLEFCPGCGSDLGSFTDVQHCPECGREL